MNEWNTYYRAFAEYKKATASEKQIRKLCEAIGQASTDGDFLESTRTYCIIDEDWIEIIEEGLEHVEKAIREERQFIRKEGEIVPIERLKRVSTATVQHLARHSELITKEPEEGETLLPEKLYMAENLSDFAVYENRFLYMLLCYLRDFINARLDKILELGRTYRLQTEIDKNVRVGRKFLKYKTTLCYEDKNDPMADEFFQASPLIERIETAQRLVVSLLMTPLMKEVSKAPMLTPPITRTNVLRMNVHFKAALEMYGKLVAYAKPGYTIEELKNSYRPLPDSLVAETAEVIALHRFLAYKYGNKLSERLREEYEQEEFLRKEREAQERREELERLKNRLDEEGVSPYEYIRLLEEENERKEKDSADLRVARKEIEHLNEKLKAQEGKLSELGKQKDELLQTVAEKNAALALQERKLEEEKVSTESKLAEARREVQAKCAAEKREFETKCMENARVLESSLQRERSAVEESAKALDEERARIEKDLVFTKAQLHGLRQQHGLTAPEDDFTSKERFMELEAEFRAFEEFFETQWKYTKKRIRQEILGKKPKRDE